MSKKEIWPRPRLNPLPECVRNVGSPCINLNGNKWKFHLDPPQDFFDPKVNISEWTDVVVPFQIESGENEYAYTRWVTIPSEWDGNRVFVRFDGANCLARVFVDGQFIRSHYGGFVSWECDITDYVTPGNSHRLVIGLTDKPQEVNPFHRGGLIRDVTLYTKPSIYISRFHADTTFDDKYENAVLTVSSRIEGGSGMIELMLISPAGEEQRLTSIVGEVGQDLTKLYDVPLPLKWDSEHPHLYRLVASLMVEDVCVEQTFISIGFRQIERRGCEVYINNQLLKLRGINRHDVHPVNGRSLSREQLEEDTGLLTEGYEGDKLVLTGGPYLQLTGFSLGLWKLDSLEAAKEDAVAKVTISGHYDRVVVRFVVKIGADSRMDTDYTIVKMPYPSPREIAISGGITSHSGGYDEVGVAYIVSGELDSLSWNRKGLWNVYPEWHLARLSGKQ